MTEITFRRKNYTPDPDKNCTHAGLLLERGFDKWNTADNQYNEQKQKFYDQLIAIKIDKLYESAYYRWKNYLEQNNCKSLEGTVDGRLYLGLGEANPLESAVTLHHTYGAPFIPGSAIKGVLHHALLERYATEYNSTEKKFIISSDKQRIIDTLFGREPDKTANSRDSGNAGYVIFNDAWWVPSTKPPLVKEVVTVHHQKYYAGEQPATDFDSPNPNPQIAIQGEFLFSIQGESSWADFALKLLQQTLQNNGIGAKTSSGYGYFDVDDYLPVLEPIEEIWPNATLTRYTEPRMGMVIEAKLDDKKVLTKWEALKSSIDKLPEDSLKKLKKKSLTHAIKVEKNGNDYRIIELFFGK